VQPPELKATGSTPVSRAPATAFPDSSLVARVGVFSSFPSVLGLTGCRASQRQPDCEALLARKACRRALARRFQLAGGPARGFRWVRAVSFSSRAEAPFGQTQAPRQWLDSGALCWGASAQPTAAFCHRQRRPKPLPLVATCPRFQTSAPERHQPHSPESRSSTTQRTPVGQPGG